MKHGIERTISMLVWGITVAVVITLLADLDSNSPEPNIDELIATLAGPAIQEEIWFAAIIAKESGGDVQAIGSAGELGPFQIMPDYWIDGCEGAGVDWDYASNVRDPLKCRRIIRGYWKKYNLITHEQRSRCHNGGPLGMFKESTKTYWLDIKQRMQKIHND